MGGICKGVLLNTAIFEGSIFGLYTLITYLTMLCEILSSIVTILLSALNVIKHLICWNNQRMFPNLILAYKTL